MAKKGQKFLRQLHIFLLLGIVGLFFGIYMKQFSYYQKLLAVEENLKHQLALEQQKGVALQREKEYYGSDLFVLEKARKDLKMIKPNEIVFIIEE